MKESGAFKVMELTAGAVIDHDDRLLLRAQKSDMGLEAEWRDTVEIRYADGRPIIVDYWTTDEPPKRASVEEWQAMDWTARQEYRPQYERGLTLAEGVWVAFRCNQMDLRLCNLFEDSGSRYRSALEHIIGLVDTGTIKYRARGADSTGRNRQESVRNRIKRYLRPTEYEHDILFRGDIGRAIMSDLRASGKARAVEDFTVYMTGHGRYDGQVKSVKFYDIGARDGATAGEYFKLETTLHKEFFKARGMGVSDMTWQADIQDKVLDELVKTVGRVLALCSRGTLDMIAQAMNVEATNAREAPRTLARAMLRRELTYGERLDALERDMEQVKRRVDRLENLPKRQ